jgi:phosphoglycerate dehydrogenase-like enzyme
VPALAAIGAWPGRGALAERRTAAPEERGGGWNASPLLSHPRVVLTPHDAGASDLVFHGLTGIIADNLRRLEAAEPLRFRLA